ncbi:hypothetical protein [Hyphomonas sediminis]|uniref:hypothetical protein n=1 Tax=Hyphomonas sediminis TaxID=2866160 RepID=UPI001CEC929D|nr:hypothetical protein [Hyphomonas sediminis]
MQTVVDFALVANATNINWITQQEMNVTAPERLAPDFSAIAEGPGFGSVGIVSATGVEAAKSGA